MNDESQNALLKTLEEPPPETLLILTTGNPASLLPTTRSRCQQISLLTNRCEFDFAGKEQVFAALGALFFEARGDLAEAEAGAAQLIRSPPASTATPAGGPPGRGPPGSTPPPRPETRRWSSGSSSRPRTPPPELT